MLWNHLVIFYEIGNERISLLLANERFLFAALSRNFQYSQSPANFEVLFSRFFGFLTF